MENVGKIFIVVILCLGNNCGFNIIELNYDLGPHSPFYPFEVNAIFKSTVQEAGYSRGFWLAYSEITTQPFLSTFLSAPYAFNEHGITLDQIPFRDLFATAVVIDVRDKAANNDKYDVSVKDVEDWVEKYGKFPKHCVVLFNTGWDEGRYPDRIAYFGTADNISEWRSPGVSIGAMKYILDHEKTHGIHIVGFGLDNTSIDNAQSIARPVIKLVGEVGKFIMHNMKELKRLPPKGAKIMMMPMKIKGGSAAPVRVAARIP
ncbi:UNVERIFIED_CONTAM: hypothetical protein RMT77_011364 [Armadillidium vulgare]